MRVTRCGHTLAEISKASSSKVLICAVERDGEVFIPSGHFIIRADDKLSFIASRKNARTFLASVGFQTHQVKSTMIVGGGRVAYYLAKQLLNMGIDVKIIENDKGTRVKVKRRAGSCYYQCRWY
ncbi:MAG: TrkA C-terminal domain-containing protein [Lachnospira pectinoschiza]